VFRSPHIRFLRRVLPDIKIAAVVQGADPEDWLMCFNVLNSLDGIDILGIPMLTTQVFGSRILALEAIKKKVRKPCHLLGFWRSTPLEEVTKERQYDFVMGIDTSKPVRLATQGKGLKQWLNIERDKQFIDKDNHTVDKELLKANCQEFVELCK